MIVTSIEHKQDTQLQARLDQGAYSEEDLFTVRIPTNLPYYTNSPKYESVEGSLELNGTEYKYVKRRVFHDSLELVCIANTSKKELQSLQHEFLKITGDWQSSEQGKKASIALQQLPLQYCNALPDFGSLSFVTTTHSYSSSTEPFTPQHYLAEEGQPPESTGSILCFFS
jgi:hypothetical protein